MTHDARVDRTTEGTGLVRNYRLSALKNLDAGYRAKSIYGDSFDGRQHRLLTLGELFERYPNIPINLDIKDASNTAAKAVATVIARHQRERTVVVASFHARTLIYFRSIAPGVATAAVKGEVARLYFAGLAGRTTTFAVPFSAVQIPISWKLIPLARQRFVKQLQAKNLAVSYWTINQADQMLHLLKMGVDGIVTDRPDIAEMIKKNLSAELDSE